MSEPSDRRPIASRGSPLIQAIARWLVRRDITPNGISILSMGAALVAGLALALGGHSVAGLVLAAAGCQLRLLCNLFDGLVAVEGGKGKPDGPFWNEAPDRISDLLILGGLGFAVGQPDLGWLAAALAILTAYVRELGRANGLGSDFSGPMAKPQRMAVVTFAALAQAGLIALGQDILILTWALWVLLIGTALTTLWRMKRQIDKLRAR